MSGIRLVLSGNVSPKWLKLSLSGGNSVVVTRCGGAAADILDQCRRLVPCVLVIEDALIGQLDPDELCAAVDHGQAIQVLVECDEASPGRAEYLLRLGCTGILKRTISLAQARRAFWAIRTGELWVSRLAISRAFHNLLQESRHRLTGRESEIVVLLAEGLKNSEIAERLFISPQTVRWHLRSLYGKLGTHDRRSAATCAPVAWHQAAPNAFSFSGNDATAQPATCNPPPKESPGKEN